MSIHGKCWKILEVIINKRKKEKNDIAIKKDSWNSTGKVPYETVTEYCKIVRRKNTLITG